MQDPSDNAAPPAGDEIDLDGLLQPEDAGFEGEHTVVDATLSEALMADLAASAAAPDEDPGEATKADAPPERSSPPPPPAPALEASLDALGPAFPDADDDPWASSTGGDTGGDETGEELSDDELPTEDDDDDDEPGHGTVATRILEEPVEGEEVGTSAAPLAGPLPSAGSLRPHVERAPEEDAWAELDDESSSGWQSITGESQVALSSERTGQLDGASLDESRVFAAGQAVELEEVRARLIGLSGGDAGREFPLAEREVSIGRTAQNTLVLSDPSVSREHARLLRDGDRYFLIDLRSGNGTFVNGQRISRARVRSGDELGFGNAVLRFVETDDEFRPIDGRGAPMRAGEGSLFARLRSSPYFKSVGVSLGIVTASLLVAAIIVLVRGGGDAKDRARRDVIFQYYLDGVDAFKRRDWGGAENKFSILLGLDPKYERGLRYMTAIAREKRAAEQWQQVRASRERGDLRQAYAGGLELLDSMYADDAQAMLDAIDADLEAKVTRARTALESGRTDEALNLLTSVELARPGRPDVAALRDRAMQATAGGGGSTPQQAPEQEEGDDDGAANTPSHGGGGHASSSGDVARAEQLFSQGRLSDALGVLRKAGGGRDVRALQSKLQKFEKAYDGAVEQANAKRADAAIKLLVQARGLEAKIASGHSSYASEIAQKLADMYYVQGMGYLFSSQLPEAYQSFRSALKSAPSHDKSERRLADLEQKAEQLISDAATLRASDPDGARAKLRIATQIVAPGRPAYRRAKSQLDALR